MIYNELGAIINNPYCLQKLCNKNVLGLNKLVLLIVYQYFSSFSIFSRK